MAFLAYSQRGAVPSEPRRQNEVSQRVALSGLPSTVYNYCKLQAWARAALVKKFPLEITRNASWVPKHQLRWTCARRSSNSQTRNFARQLAEMS